MKSIGTLILRVSLGLTMLIAHGYPKIVKFGAEPGNFPDPLGIGNAFSFYGAVGAEAVCSLLLVLGLFTRAATLPLIFTMLVAAFVVHGSDPWQKKELAFMYLYGYVALMFLGGGIVELQAFIRPKLQGIQNGFLRWLLEA